ncbi:MAG TPA: hypothetical protein PK156_15925, partial [Polyangium sp.]|nr:hypothetical protein [Polyangium sp.]
WFYVSLGRQRITKVVGTFGCGLVLRIVGTPTNYQGGWHLGVMVASEVAMAPQVAGTVVGHQWEV